MAANYISGDIRNGMQTGIAESTTTEIQDVLSRMEAEIAIMMDRVTSLHDALQPIMLPASPTGEARTADRATETPLGNRLSHQRDNLRNISGSVLELLNRIAL